MLKEYRYYTTRKPCFLYILVCYQLTILLLVYTALEASGCTPALLDMNSKSYLLGMKEGLPPTTAQHILILLML